MRFWLSKKEMLLRGRMLLRQDSLHHELRSAKLNRQLPNTRSFCLPSCSDLPSFAFRKGSECRSSDVPSSCASRCHATYYATADELVFKLGERGQQLKQQFS
jgi:hypothetical protein